MKERPVLDTHHPMRLAVTCLILACSAPAFVAGADDAFHSTDLFVAGAGGYHTYRIPSLIVSNHGNVLAFCEGRKASRADDGDIDLLLRRSEDGGMTWGPAEVVHEEGGDAKITIGNPCPVVDESSGRIWLPFCRNNYRVFVTFSDDEGKTWAAPRDITADVKSPGWTWYATGPGVGIQLHAGPHRGRLLIPCDHYEPDGEKSVTHSHVISSDDHGETWRLGGSLGPYTNECQAVQLADGRLLLNARNHWSRDGGEKEKGKRRLVAASDDGGRTWSEPQPDETLIEPICQASLIRISAGDSEQDRLLFSNPASRSARARLTVRRSDDGGHTWPASLLLHDGPAAYSSLADLDGERAGCLYECGEKEPYERIRFTRFSHAAIAPE